MKSRSPQGPLIKLTISWLRRRRGHPSAKNPYVLQDKDMGWSVIKDDQSKSKESDTMSDDIDEKKEDDLSVQEVTFRERFRDRLVRWSRRVNPFYVDDPPPVLDSDAGLIPEVTANWFKRLTFGWLAPLMLVIPKTPHFSSTLSPAFGID